MVFGIYVWYASNTIAFLYLTWFPPKTICIIHIVVHTIFQDDKKTCMSMSLAYQYQLNFIVRRVRLVRVEHNSTNMSLGHSCRGLVVWIFLAEKPEIHLKLYIVFDTYVWYTSNTFLTTCPWTMPCWMLVISNFLTENEEIHTTVYIVFDSYLLYVSNRAAMKCPCFWTLANSFTRTIGMCWTTLITF